MMRFFKLTKLGLGTRVRICNLRWKGKDLPGGATGYVTLRKTDTDKGRPLNPYHNVLGEDLRSAMLTLSFPSRSRSVLTANHRNSKTERRAPYGWTPKQTRGIRTWVQLEAVKTVGLLDLAEI